MTWHCFSLLSASVVSHCWANGIIPCQLQSFMRHDIDHTSEQKKEESYMVLVVELSFVSSGQDRNMHSLRIMSGGFDSIWAARWY